VQKMPEQLLSVAECMARLKIKMSERTFRQKARAAGAMEHRRQLMLTESDFQRVLEGLRTCSNSSSGGRRGSTKSSVPSADSATAKALALLRSRTQKHSSPSDRKRSLTVIPGAR